MLSCDTMRNSLDEPVLLGMLLWGTNNATAAL